jgi:hypothetical protein
VLSQWHMRVREGGGSATCVVEEALWVLRVFLEIRWFVWVVDAVASVTQDVKCLASWNGRMRRLCVLEGRGSVQETAWLAAFCILPHLLCC